MNIFIKSNRRYSPILLFFIVLTFFPFVSSVTICNPYLPNGCPAAKVSTIIINGTSSEGNITTFLELLDTPNSYVGEGENCVAVNVGETGLEFVSCGAGAESDPIFLAENASLWAEAKNKYNATYNNILNQQCPSGYVVNGTLSNGTFTCVVSTGSGMNYTNLVLYNQTLPAGQNITLGTGGWFKGLFNLVIDAPSIIWLAFNGTTLSFNETQLNNSIISVGLAAGFNSSSNATYNNILNQQCPSGYMVNGTLANGTFTCALDATGAAVSIGYYVNYTPITTTGNITNGTLKGYSAANKLCDYYYSGSHMCQIGEMLNSINRNQSNANFTATFRAAEGAPGYLANANDCDGLTSPAAADLGSIWVGSITHTNTYGSASLVSCSASRAIGCCI